MHFTVCREAVWAWWSQKWCVQCSSDTRVRHVGWVSTRLHWDSLLWRTHRKSTRHHYYDFAGNESLIWGSCICSGGCHNLNEGTQRLTHKECFVWSSAQEKYSVSFFYFKEEKMFVCFFLYTTNFMTLTSLSLSHNQLTHLFPPPPPPPPPQNWEWPLFMTILVLFVFF